MVGCAAAPKPQPVALQHPAYDEVASSALAFDPPIAEGALHPELARGPREPSVAFGFQQSTTEVYVTATDDYQQYRMWGGFYTKESVSVKSSINSR